MKICLITSKNDPSSSLFLDNRIPGTNISIVYYESLNHLPNIESLLSTYDKYILRDPYNSGQDYSHILKHILLKHSQRICLDSACYLKYPDYEDKLFQANFYKKNLIPHPPTLHNPSLSELKNYPYLVKKRISSRNKGNYIVANIQDFVDTPYSSNPNDYIVQQKIDILHEYRILILFNQIVGIAEKSKSSGKLKLIKSISTNQISLNAQKLAQYTAKKLEADFVGIDLAIDKNQKIYVIESNLSPQFNRLLALTHINPVEIIFRRVLS